MKNLEIRIKAIRVIEKVIILKANVFNGCHADAPELEIEEKRLESIKTWATSNNELKEIQNWFASKTFGNHLQFQAFEVSKFFHS